MGSSRAPAEVCSLLPRFLVHPALAAYCVGDLMSFFRTPGELQSLAEMCCSGDVENLVAQIRAHSASAASLSSSPIQLPLMFANTYVDFSSSPGNQNAVEDLAPPGGGWCWKRRRCVPDLSDGGGGFTADSGEGAPPLPRASVAPDLRGSPAASSPALTLLHG
jgi:hypothetical protein